MWEILRVEFPRTFENVSSKKLGEKYRLHKWFVGQPTRCFLKGTFLDKYG